jgi:hypothetical protein
MVGLMDMDMDMDMNMDMDVEYLFDTLATLHRSMLTTAQLSCPQNKRAGQTAEWSPGGGSRRSQQAMEADWTV